MPYRSSLHYQAERIHAAAIYCSDGRVGAHFEDFLTNGLRLPRYDRLALPGGPASLAGHSEAHLDGRGILDELRFLVAAHELQRVVLIAHQGCSFYSSRLRLAGAAMEHQQRTDLRRAADLVREIAEIAQVEAYFARLDADAERISFDSVLLDP